MIRCLSPIAIVAACVSIAGAVEAHSDAACIGYMEADFHYKIALEMAEDTYSDAKVKVDASYSDDIDKAEAIRAAALEESTAALSDANAKTDATYKSTVGRIELDLKTAKGKFEAAKIELRSAYESAIDEARFIRRTVIEKVKLEYNLAQEKAATARDKASEISEVRNIYNRDMKQIAATYQFAKEKADSDFFTMEARAKEILEEAAEKVIIAYGAAEASYAAAKQAAIANRDKVKRQASALYQAAKTGPDAHYRAAVGRANSERVASRKQIRIAYEHAKQTAKVNRWHSYIHAYEGETSDIPSIMEKVLNVDRHRCRLKFGD